MHIEFQESFHYSRANHHVIFVYILNGERKTMKKFCKFVRNGKQLILIR